MIHLRVLCILVAIGVVVSGEQFENSTNICDNRCNCISSTGILTLNCTSSGIQHALSSWPTQIGANQTQSEYQKIIATFSDNTIVTLEKLPPTDGIIEVSYSHCGITYLENDLLAATKNLKFLDLSYNNLTGVELSPDKFKGPYDNEKPEPINLEHLNLAYNQIHSLQKNLFEHMPNLKTLNLEGNNFRVLDFPTQGALNSVNQLEILNLANNDLTELVETAVEQFKKLKELNLASNQLDFVPTALIHVKNSLQTLNIDDNPIIEMTEDSFLGLENLLDLSANNLTRLAYINANTFVQLVRLRKLSLSNNFLLSEINRQAFRVNTLLKEFYLNNNRLFNIDCTLLQWPQLDVFEFKDNPLDCSCDLYNITQALSYGIKRDEDSPYCTDPRDRRAKQVFSLKRDICLFKPFPMGLRSYPRHLSIPLILLSVVMILSIGVAIGLGYTRYRRMNLDRTVSANAVSPNVMYNPLSTNRF